MDAIFDLTYQCNEHLLAYVLYRLSSGRVDQWAESMDLKSIQCGFESHHVYHYAIKRCSLIGKIRSSKTTSMVVGRHHLILRCRYRTVVKGEKKLSPVIIGDYVNLVDGLLWEQEAVGSSPASPTIDTKICN